jgi:hypothetical protein
MRPNAVAWLLAVSAVIATTGSAFAQADTTHTAPLPSPPPVTGTDPTSRGRISGLVFGDLYYNVAGDPTHHYNAAGADSGKSYIDGNGTPITKDLNGAQIRRIYFQLDNDLSIKYSTRFRLEADSKELTSGGKIGVFVKAAYIQAKDWIPRGNAFLGMANTPTFENSEEFWGYRAIEKTITDFRGLASSSDLGVLLKATSTAVTRSATRHARPDTGQRPENNRRSAPISRFRWLIEVHRIEPYVDYEGSALAGERDRALPLRRVRIQAPGTRRRGLQTGDPQLVTRIRSGTGLRAGRRGISHAYARYDKFQPDTKGANRVDPEPRGVRLGPYRTCTSCRTSSPYNTTRAAPRPAVAPTQARITFYTGSQA